MIGLVLVTHGRLAAEFITALEHVVGPQEAVEGICIDADDDMELRRKDIADAIERVSDVPTVLRVALATDPADAAWVVVAGTPYAGVTDDDGVVQLGAAPAGTYAVRAWLPPGPTAPARTATGKITVVAGAPATVTVRLDDGAGGSGAAATP